MMSPSFQWSLAMKYVVACFSLAAGCHSTNPVAIRTTPALESPSLPSMLPLCVDFLEGKDVSAELASHPLVAKMATGMAPQVVFTPSELAQASREAKPTPQFSWDRLRQNAHYVRPFANAWQSLGEKLLAESLARATEPLDVNVNPSAVRIHLVCGGPWDAYVLIFDQPELFFDVGWVADTDISDLWREFGGLLTHELWHLAFLEHQRIHNWPDYRQSQDAVDQFVYRMLNEGAGHYFSAQISKMDPGKLKDRAHTAFELLARRYPKYKSTPDPETRQKLLWNSHAGVPFWEKWGAIPGAIVVHCLIQDRGNQGLKELLQKNPFSVFIAYTALEKRTEACPALPLELIADLQDRNERR